MNNNPFKPPLAAQRKDYAVTTRGLVEHFGSYEKIAQELYRETGEQFAGATVGRWFREGDTPVKVVVALAELSGWPWIIGSLCPYLKDYLIQEAQNDITA